MKTLVQINEKCVYFGDMMLSFDNDTLEDEFKNCILPKLEEHGLTVDISKLEIIEVPPETPNFDIMFFDYGGLMPGCDGLIYSVYSQMQKLIEENPSKLFVIVTRFTAMMLKDDYFPKVWPGNTFESIDDFANFYKA